MSSSALPLNAKCPRCGANVGWSCTSPTGIQCLTHRARWKAVGVVSPSDWDLLRDAEDRAKRRVEHIREGIARRRSKE